MLTINVKNVIRYESRKARVLPILKMNRDSDESIKLEKYLLQKTNSESGNHICYDILDKKGGHIGVLITGNEIWIGSEVIVEPW